jgi:hypothetical protein
MTSPIDRRRNIGGGTDRPLGATRRDDTAESLFNRILAPPRREVDTAVIIRADRVYNKPSEVSSAERILETRQAAIEAVRAVREEQLRLATEAESLPQSSRLTTLDSQRGLQQAEIGRIGRTLTVNGFEVLSDSEIVVSSTDISRNINEVSVLPKQANLFGWATSLLTPSLASSAKGSYEEALSALSSFLAGNTAVNRKFSTIIQREDPGVIADKAEADAQSRSDAIDPAALASAIAAQITDPFLNERNRQAIIDTSAAKLDPERAKALLDDDEGENST